ncbi:MAG: sulfatase [Rhodocyclales bacterium]|jgi:membrane-anchored protein YejM (alkaline phosphatase superfamily)|nr:MAG: sulfatase [Rhodocyclales bacterium]
MPVLPSVRQLNRFFLLSWLIAVVQVAGLQSARQFAEPAVAGWTLAATVSYAFIYLLPALLLVRLLRRLLAGRPWRGAGLLLSAAAVGLTGMTQALLYADHLIRDMYGFHINGFVIDLVFTPGGIAALGAGWATQLTAAAIVSLLIAAQAAAYAWAMRRRAPEAAAARNPWRWALLALVLIGTGERVAYAYSAAANYQPILFASERYPLYQPLTFRKLAKRLGIASSAEETQSLRVKEGQLAYPLKPLQVEVPAVPLNIVWLVAESLRFDMLDPKIMPRLWAFSNDALRLEKHFSGGNLTQMGVFSMFYGLYGSNWFPMRAAQRAPVLMDVLQRQNYQFALHTSQRFTYPAFDKTIFANMRPEDMHALEGGATPWQRDAKNIDDLLGFIDRRDPSRPFMGYMFFESTHAPYDFPPEAAIARPYLENFNYLTADFATQTPQIKNRYINAAHHVDGQIGRVIDHLKAKGLLDRTIVVVLGDHGEEFMERGRWGHSAEFNRFQTGTPAVIRVPGQAPRVVSGITSHLDIPATLMPLLGVKNPPSDYSHGYDLLAPGYRRDYAVAADWNRIAYIGNDFKVSFPVNALGAIRNEVTDGDDRPLADSGGVIKAIRTAMLEIMGNLTRFSRAPS